MTSKEIRERFLDFFQKRGHAILPSSPLIPQNDPSVLFNTAGMQPLVPYLLGQSHPLGKRLASAQKCIRTVDIDCIGDNTHATFFEMLGNWSLGDYWKKESIEWSYEFLTSKVEGLGLDPQRLYVTCFEGDENAPKDLESAEIWLEIFRKNKIEGERIYFRPASSNWWGVGASGPCGPDTEIFYDLSGDLISGMTEKEYLNADKEQKIVEVWNNVFMEYLKKDGVVSGKLNTRNVDTGSGFERIVMAVQDKKNIFGTDLFLPLIEHIRVNPSISNFHSERIIADHVRTAVFLLAEGVLPANTDHGYVLRRLIRRAVRHADLLHLPPNFLPTLVPIIGEIYSGVYDEINVKRADIVSELSVEEDKFRKTLKEGMKQFEKMIENNSAISAKDVFKLFSSYGFPFELTVEMAKERGVAINEAAFQAELLIHKEISRVGSEQKFKGGLAGSGEMEMKYHTATHLLHQALRDVLGSTVTQKGSNITPERLRFDFTFERKMTDAEMKKVEDIVNGKIKDNLPVKMEVMKKTDAEKTGALHFFADKYGDQVSVYYIGESLPTAYSKEFCGGPHVSQTGELAKGTSPEDDPKESKFKIIKEEAVSAGVRRIKAILQ